MEGTLGKLAWSYQQVRCRTLIFFIVISCYFIYERNPNGCLVCRLLLNTIVPRQRGRFWMREPRPASRTIVDCQPFRYLFLRCLLW